METHHKELNVKNASKKFSDMRCVDENTDDKNVHKDKVDFSVQNSNNSSKLSIDYIKPNGNDFHALAQKY